MRSRNGKRKTICSNCGNKIEQNRILCNQYYCKSCHAANMRIKRPKHSNLPDEQRKKANARAYANVYVKRGKIIKQSCEICGKFAQMHHEDYNKPLEVRWFCRKHHLELHNN